MKREELLKLFPGILDEEIKDLPNDLVVCWYPSSGTGCDSETLYNGYGINILDHWKQQSSNFKPNLFIFSDIREFDLHDEVEVLFTKTYFEDPIIEFLSNLDSIDYSLFPSDDYLLDSRYINDIKHLYSLGIIGSDDDLIQAIENATSLIEKENNKLIFKILVDANLVLKDKIIDIRKKNEAYSLESGKYGSLKMVTFMKFLDTYFILVQGTNEYIYKRFIEEDVKIPLLTLNRPMDPFIFDQGIDIKKLGIQEFIAGHSYVSSLVLGDEFKKHPDFVFQLFNEVHNDIANLYSYNIKTV
jgi:hypothetical protein